MKHPLLDVSETESPQADYVTSAGSVFAVFDAGTQDSGNVSYGVTVAGERFFVKTAGQPDSLPGGTRIT